MVQIEFQQIHESAVAFSEGSLYPENTVENMAPIAIQLTVSSQDNTDYIHKLSFLEQTRKKMILLSFFYTTSLILTIAEYFGLYNMPFILVVIMNI